MDGSQTEATMLQVYPVGPVMPSPTLPTPTCALSRQPTRDGRQRTSSRPHANPDRGERGRAKLFYDSAGAHHSGRLHILPRGLYPALAQDVREAVVDAGLAR